MGNGKCEHENESSLSLLRSRRVISYTPTLLFSKRAGEREKISLEVGTAASGRHPAESCLSPSTTIERFEVCSFSAENFSRSNNKQRIR